MRGRKRKPLKQGQFALIHWTDGNTPASAEILEDEKDGWVKFHVFGERHSSCCDFPKLFKPLFVRPARTERVSKYDAHHDLRLKVHALQKRIADESPAVRLGAAELSAGQSDFVAVWDEMQIAIGHWMGLIADAKRIAHQAAKVGAIVEDDGLDWKKLIS